MRQSVASSLFASFGMAILLVLWLRPSFPPSPLEAFALVAFLQLSAFGVARWLAPSRGVSAVKALVSAAFFSVVIVLVSRPSVAVSFDLLFVLVTLVELGGLAVARLLQAPSTKGE